MGNICFFKVGGEDYDDLDIYLVVSNVVNGHIISTISNDFAKILFDHFIFMNTDFLIVPDIDDGFSSWRTIVGYETNDELVSYFQLIMSQLWNKFDHTLPYQHSKYQKIRTVNSNQKEVYKNFGLGTTIM